VKTEMAWLSDPEIEAVIEEALGVLEDVGLRMAGSRALGALAAAGGRVEGDCVRLPRELVWQATAQCPRVVTMAGATPDSDVVLDGRRSYFNVSGCGAKTLDYRSGALRPSTLADLREGTRVLDATPELDVMWTFLSANDVAEERRQPVEYYTYLTETQKPVVLVEGPSHPDTLRQIIELVGEAGPAYAARPRVSVLCAVHSPLDVNGELLDTTIRFAALGAPVWVYSMPIAGATSPVTLAGTLALAWAEILGTITAIQASAPGAAVIACCGPGILSMQTGTISLGCLENSIMGGAAVQIGHRLGLPTHNAGLATDAKHLGVQAGYEKGLKALAATATGADIISGGFGLLDSCSAFYLPMVPVDAEIAAMAKRLARGVEVTSATLQGDAIRRVGIGGDYLRERETRTRVRAGEHFLPRIAARLPMDRWMQDPRTEIDVAVGIVEDTLARRRERAPYLTDDVRAELAAICGVTPAEAEEAWL
jgi:trimethylamine--corrinoid protein Co-methyltransferase